jgi:hypothetical protein
MVIYDHWSYMTIIFRVLAVMWGILCEGIRMDGVVIQGKLQKTNSACLGLVDTQFSHTRAQGAAVESKDF